MFVECFSGLMGGGKSFYSVIRSAEHIAEGGIVFSNIRFILDPWFNEAYSHKLKSFWLPECNERCRMEMHKGGLVLPVMRRDKSGKPEFEYNSRGLRHYLRVEYKWNLQEGQYHYIPDEMVNASLPMQLPKGSQTRPVLVILDEALDHFEAGASSKNATAEFRSFLRHIRKLGINLIFIAQDFGSLESRIRALTHFVWRFRDMYTWPVPIFNRPLPSPWRDHIVCEKFHRIQFGKAKSEAINRKTWIMRDTLVFQCYQSISLHNSGIKMADDMKTDFGESGKIVKGKKMNAFERVALFACLIISIVGLFLDRKGPVAGSAEVVADDSSSAPGQDGFVSPDEVQRVDVLYGQFRYASINGVVRNIYVDGHKYYKGLRTSAGTVLRADSELVHIMDAKGNVTFIYPDYSARFSSAIDEVAKTTNGKIEVQAGKAGV